MGKHGAKLPSRPRALGTFEQDLSRRAAALRMIAGVGALASLAVLLIAPARWLPWLTVMQLASALGYCTIWATARSSQHPERGGLALVGILLVQLMVASRQVSTTALQVNLAYFASVASFIAAVTMGPRATMLTGTVFAAWLAAQIGMHIGAPTLTTLEPFVAPVAFFISIWIVAMAASIANRRALKAQARDEVGAKEAREAAHEAEERYRIVSDCMSDLVAVFDCSGNYLYASPSHKRVLGEEPDALLGRQAPELIHPEDLTRCVEAFERAKQTGSSFFATRLHVADGSYRWFHFGFSTVELGGMRGLVASARDITEERMLGEALESTRRMEALGRLAGGVAHDFNNLLLVIGSCTELAAARLPPDHPSRKELRDVSATTERAAAITRQLLTFARRQVLPKAETASTAQVVRELSPILARIVGSNVALKIDVENTRNTVNASPVQLEQIVMNLAANARDAMPEGGTLTVSAHDRLYTESLDDGKAPAAGRYVELEVTDTGVGMSDEVKKQIFEPFFTTKPTSQGTGLGLATVFGLVSQLGGRISVRSAPGAGSSFTILLPASGFARTREQVVIPEASPTARPLDVLVVDDEPTVRELIARMLREAGHRAREAGSLEAALATAEAPGTNLDAIVTDVVVGSGDGLAMLDRLAAAQPDAGIVVISGFSPSPDRVARVSELGAEFIAKPFGSTELLGALARARSHSPGLTNARSDQPREPGKA